MAIFGRTRGSFGIDPETQQAVNQFAQLPQQPVQQQAQPSTLDKIINAAQGVGAALRDDPGIYESFQNRQAAQQQFQMRRQDQLTDYQRRMEDERNNWLFQQQWERANPKPVNNDTVADYEFWKQHMSPEQFQAYVQNKADPPQYRQGADGQFYRISPATPPPITEDDWNKGHVIGGPTQGASGNFSIPSGNPLDPFRR